MELLLLVCLVVVCLLLVTLLSVLMYRQSQSQTQLLKQMLASRETLIQSLLNQLRSQDPQTVLALNAATSPQTFSPEPAYVPMTDAYEAQLSGQVDELTAADIEAFGSGYFPGVS